MYREIEQCIGELRVNHTDKDIAGALSEYFQIVKSVSYDYTGTVTVADLRADHPELNFMDDEEIEEILEQAGTMRRKRGPDEDERLTMDDMQRLLARNKDWGGAGSAYQRIWIPLAAGHGVGIDELAAMVWICTSSARATMPRIKETMREYLAEKRAKEKIASSGKATSGYDVEFAEECIRAHMGAFSRWPYGDVRKIDVDENGVLRIYYTGGRHWHYKEEDGSIVWW